MPDYLIFRIFSSIILKNQKNIIFAAEYLSAFAEATADEGRNGPARRDKLRGIMRLRVKLRWRNGRAVECGGLENRCPPIGGPGVRIPLSPPKASDQTRSSCCGFFVLLKDRTLLALVRALNKTKNARRAPDLMPLKLPHKGS